MGAFSDWLFGGKEPEAEGEAFSAINCLFINIDQEAGEFFRVGAQGSGLANVVVMGQTHYQNLVANQKRKRARKVNLLTALGVTEEQIRKARDAANSIVNGDNTSANPQAEKEHI